MNNRIQSSLRLPQKKVNLTLELPKDLSNENLKDLSNENLTYLSNDLRLIYIFFFI